MVKRDLIRNIVLLAVAVVAIICLRIFVFTPYTISQNDTNTFLEKNDLVIANKLDQIERSDLVLYQVDGKRYVGRIIALENDSVVYMDDVLYLNDQIQAEDYLSTYREKYLASNGHVDYFTHDFTIETLTQTAAKRIPANSFLILNDQRQNMQDSRTFGLIKEEQIEGVLSFRVFPLERFGFIKNK